MKFLVGVGLRIFAVIAMALSFIYFIFGWKGIEIIFTGLMLFYLIFGFICAVFVNVASSRLK